ncbi:kinase-regulated stress-responsive transcription factor skn7, partial [Tulasnella sp. 417]
DNSLPPLSPYNQRPPYPLSTSFPPPLSRLPSQHQVPPHSPPPPPFYQQPPSWYYPPLPSSHDHGHWSSQQNGRHDPPRLPSPIAAEPWETEDTGAPADDFIKTLAKMLDDPYCSQIVSWGPKGDCFVVKDMTEFARFILPRMFKHSNYTSFVRQLNKYDFRQIKNSDEFGDQCWTFQHPDFQRSNSDAMENIKWKVPVQRKAMRERAATRPNLPWSASDAAIGGDGLGKVIVTDGDERPLFPHLNGVAGMSYSGSTVSVDSNSILVNGSSSELSSMERPFLARPEPMRRLEEPIRAHKARNAAAFAELPPLTPELPLAERSFFARQESMQRPEELNRAHEGRNGVDVAERPPSPPELSPAELSFLIRQEPMRRMEELKCARKARDAAVVAELPPFTPAWAVPPRVLLVEDDQVSRHKFSKFLQVSGCTIDVAVDGVGAVNKMSVEKYDLVLMDTVLPTLDGVSATSVIRQFDRMTPIIAMASDSKPKDIATYYASGMNDILAKPFTQESLFTMLEKHLTHLKADDMVRPVREEPSKVLTEDRDSMPIEALLRRIDGVDYFPPPAPTTGNVVALTNPITRARKRALETVDDDREGKRSRFEVVE